MDLTVRALRRSLRATSTMTLSHITMSIVSIPNVSINNWNSGASEEANGEMVSVNVRYCAADYVQVRCVP